MRKLLCCSFSLAIFLFNCKGQLPKINTADSSYSNGEFQKNANGLIYSEQDIKALRFVVDSLNLRFKSCDLSKKYYSYPQARAYILNFSSKTNDLSQIAALLPSNPSFNTLVSRYSSFVENSDSNSLVVQLHDREEGKWQYLLGKPSGGFDNEYLLSGKEKCATGKWIFEYNKKGSYHDYYSINCIYITAPFSQTAIPDKYARLIQYIDCMIDTSAKIFLGSAESDNYDSKVSTRCGAYYKEINDYLNKKMNLVKKKDDYTYDYIAEEKITYAKTNLLSDAFLNARLKLLTDLYLKNETGTDDIEELIAAFISKEKALEIKRKRRVYGQCSMDQSPRIHAKNIAILAAETHSWDIFLRSHLNIMNDRFERMSDGSYAWGQRQTYIKELEVLDINVTDMMFGLSMRAYNVSGNHYNGTVWRIGKALSESKDRLKFEEEAKTIMKDGSLDQFNRSLIFLLYHTYLNYLTDKNERKQKVADLKKTATEYPSFIQAGIEKVKTDLTD